MKKSKLIRVSCLCVALVVLTGSLAAAAFNGSPYDTLKRAVFDAMTYQNVTVEMDATITLNGVIIESEYSKTINGNNSSLTWSNNPDNDELRLHYQSNGFNLYPGYYAGDDETPWYNAYVHQPYDGFNNRNYGFNSFMGGMAMSQEDRNSARFRFMEMLFDAMVGDLKNNVTMSSADGVRKISGTLTDSQLPAIAKAGIDAAIEQQGNYGYTIEREISFDKTSGIQEHETVRLTRTEAEVTVYRHTLRPMTSEDEENRMNGKMDGVFYHHRSIYDKDTGAEYIVTNEEIVRQERRPVTRADYNSRDVMDIPMKRLVLDYARGDAEVDAQGNLLSLDLNAEITITNIFGDVNELSIQVSVRFSDIGTSNPVCPIPGADKLLTSKFVKERFGSDNINVFFTVNPDGSINEDSLTTTWPGEMDQAVDHSPVSVSTVTVEAVEEETVDEEIFDEEPDDEASDDEE